MLACADRNGEVQGSIPGLARIAGVPVEDCRAAIAKFLSPDLDSRTKEDEGRRIEEISGGWLLLNYRKYRDMASDEDRKNQAAVRQKRFRDRASRNSNATVTQPSRQIPQAEGEAKGRGKEEYIQEPSAPVAHSDSKTPIAPADSNESQPSPPKQPIPLPSRREPTPSSAPPLPKRKATRSPEDHARYGKCLEAIVTVNGVKLSDCPKSAIAIAGKAINEIWEVMPSVTPEEILQRIQRARVKFSWMKGINERTIATKWAELAGESKTELTPENI